MKKPLVKITYVTWQELQQSPAEVRDVHKSWTLHTQLFGLLLYLSMKYSPLVSSTSPFWKRLRFIYMILRRFYQQRSTFHLHEHEKGELWYHPKPVSLPPAQSTVCRSEHCQVTTGLGRFRLSFKSDDVPWFKENKTLMTGTLSPKPKWKHFDWTNGRLWWLTISHLKSMQDIFWDVLQLQGQLTGIFSL